MNVLRKILVETGGVLLILFGIFHASFWILFDWKADLPNLEILNSSIMQILNITLVTLLISRGILLLACKQEILDSKLGRGLLTIISLFFAVRLVCEFVFPEGSVAMACLLFICTLVYFVPVAVQSK